MAALRSPRLVAVNGSFAPASFSTSFSRSAGSRARNRSNSVSSLDGRAFFGGWLPLTVPDASRTSPKANAANTDRREWIMKHLGGVRTCCCDNLVVVRAIDGDHHRGT